MVVRTTKSGNDVGIHGMHMHQNMLIAFMLVSREQFQASLANIWDIDQDEQNVNLFGMEGMDDHNADTYSKWDVGILRFNRVNQLCLFSHNMLLSPWDSQPITFQMDCCTYV